MEGPGASGSQAMTATRKLATVVRKQLRPQRQRQANRPPAGAQNACGTVESCLSELRDHPVLGGEGVLTTASLIGRQLAEGRLQTNHSKWKRRGGVCGYRWILARYNPPWPPLQETAR